MASSQPPSDVKQRLKASYDSMAPQYNKWTERHNDIRMQYLEKLQGAVPKLAAGEEPASIVELGCGAGQPFLDTLLSRNTRLTATANDLSDTQISLARENLAGHSPRVTFVPGDMAKVDVPEGSQAAVVALYSLIHLSREEQDLMTRRIAGWLEPGGCLLATFSAEEQPGVVMEKWLDEKGWMFWSGLGVEVTLRLLGEVGLEVVSREVEGDTQEKFLWIIARKPAT